MVIAADMSPSIHLHVLQTWYSPFWSNRYVVSLCLGCVVVRHPCDLLSADSAKTLPSVFFLSRFDHCNSLLSGCPKHLLEKLQKVQNSAARPILKAHERDHVSPLLNTLSLLFLWYSPCLSVWPPLCLLSIKTAPLLIWLKNSTHSAHKDQNIWTPFIFPCCCFCLEFSA